MSDITLPHLAAGDFAAGQTSSADDLAEDIYSPNTTPDSLDVINGFLDSDNVDSGTPWKPGKNSFAFGEFSRIRSVGRTITQAYPRDAFQTGSNEGNRKVFLGLEFNVTRDDPDLFVFFNAQFMTEDAGADATISFVKWAPSDTGWVVPTSYSIPIRRRAVNKSTGFEAVPLVRSWSSTWNTGGAEAGLWRFGLALQRLGTASDSDSAVLLHWCNMTAFQL